MALRPLLVLLLASLAPATGTAPGGSDRFDPAEAARECLALVESGSADDALLLAKTALEHAPDDPFVLAAAARAEDAAGDADAALWYALLGLDAASAAGGAAPPDALERLTEIAERLLPTERSPQELLDGYARSLFDVARTCQRKKLHANAVELFDRCKGTAYEEQARAQLERMFSNERTVEALLDSGIEIPAKPVTKRPAEWIAKEDAKHEKWENAYEIQTKNYTVITNMGYEMAQSISLAMEQMNRYYRKVFQYKERGGSMRRCKLSVYAKRDEFDVHEGKSDPGLGGFFVPLENRVATYDPRSVGGALTGLWETLFHEASHQFTRAISKNEIPAWLNEGTASFFEGAKLRPDGRVEPNGIPRSRLKSLLARLDSGNPTLKQVVSYFQPGSYPGEYYPFGWGLVYFIQNYENERSERPYLPVYLAYMDEYKSGGKHDPFERWVDYFVKKARQPGIDSFEAFEENWMQWIRDLGDIYFGGPETADVLVERARVQSANGKHEYAVESYRWALEKRPDDARAWYELARVLRELGSDDGAIHALRQCLELARGAADPDAELAGFGGESAEAVARKCLEEIRSIDRTVAKGLDEARDELLSGVAAATRELSEAGFPRAALHLARSTLEVAGTDRELAALADGIRAESGLDLRRWRRLPVDAELTAWRRSGAGEWSAEGDSVVLATDGLTVLVHRDEIPASYRYEGVVEPGDGEGLVVFGLVFGADDATGMRMFALLPTAGIVGIVTLDEGPEISESFGPPPPVGDGGLRLAVEVDGRDVEFYADGRLVGKRTLDRHEVEGSVGVFGQSTEARFRELRLLY